MKKLITTTVAVALFSTIAIAQEKPAAKPAATVADPVIIAAGDLAIKQSEFEEAIKTLPAEYQQFAMGPGKRQFAEDYLRMKLLAAEGVKNGLDKEASVVRQLQLMRENLVANAQIKKMEEAIAVSEADLKKTYEAGKAEYERVKARHILVAWKGSPASPEGNEMTEEQAKAKAEELRKKITGGSSFEEVAKAESHDVGSGSQGGDLGQFARGQMVPEFEKAAFEGKVGEILPLVRTQFGWHIIKVESHDFTPFEEVKATLEREARQSSLQTAMDALKTKTAATYNTAYFGEEPKEAAPKQ